MRPCKDMYTASERLAPYVDGVTVERVRGGFEIHTGGIDAVVTKNGPNTLAYLASVVRLSFGADLDAIREAVRWHGQVPARGITAHQETALKWLRGEVD